MVNFSASSIISEAWEYAKKHFLMMAVFLIVIYVIDFTISSLIGGPSTSEVQEIAESGDTTKILELYGQMTPSLVLSSLISAILAIGIIATALNIVMGKKDKVDFSGYQMPFVKWVKLIAAQIIYEFIVSVGFCCCIIPGIILGARLFPVQTCILDNDDLPFLDAFKMSWNMTKGHTMQLIWLAIIVMVVNIVGACCCCVGLLFTIPLTYFAQALVYAVLKEQVVNTYEG